MKKHNTVKVVLIVILLFLLLTWILPAAYYSSEYVEEGRVQMGLFDLANYPFTSLSYFGYIALFVILVGGFYGILNKIPAYHNYLERFAAKLKGKEYFALTIISLILAFGVSICGMQLAFAIFIPLIVSLIFLMGYDKIVAALVIVGSMTVGFAGSTYATGNLSVLTSTLSLDTDYQIGVRFVILLVGIILVVFNTIMYIRKHKDSFGKITKNVDKSSAKKEDLVEKVETVEEEKDEEKEEKKSTSKKTSAKSSKSSGKKNSSKTSTSKKTTTKKSSSRKSANKAAVVRDDVIMVNTNTKKAHIWPFNLFFLIIFVIMVLAFIPWSDAFNNSAMESATTAVTEFELFGFPIFGKILGSVNQFGSWTIVDMLVPLFIAVILLALIYKVKFDDMIDGFIEGAKKALLPAVIVVLLYTVLVLVTYHPFQLVVYKAIIGSKFNIVTTAITAILSSIVNFEPAYVFQSVLPYYASVVTNTANYPLVGVIFQSMYGFTMLFAPTSLILMTVLSYLDISYGEWLKNVWKLLLEFFVILLIVFIILALI